MLKRYAAYAVLIVWFAILILSVALLAKQLVSLF